MLLVGLCLTPFTIYCDAQTTVAPAQIPARITAAIDDDNRIQLPGDVHPWRKGLKKFPRKIYGGSVL
jgi:hypothetical protein